MSATPRVGVAFVDNIHQVRNSPLSPGIPSIGPMFLGFHPFRHPVNLPFTQMQISWQKIKLPRGRETRHYGTTGFLASCH